MCNNHTDCYDGSDEADCKANRTIVYQVAAIVVDSKNSNSASVLVDIKISPSDSVKLEYLASYSVSGKDAFINTTWTKETPIRICDLSAFSSYNLTFYVRVEGSQLVHPPALYTTITTKADGPSAPWNVTLKQTSATQVLVRWNAPVHSNGQIINYRVSVSPSSPPYSMKAKSTEHIVSTAFAAGTNYTFNVVAENTFSAGIKSADVYLVLDPDAIIAAVTNLKVQAIEDQWAYLTWSPVSNISGYAIKTESNNNYASYPAVNTTETSCNITGLSPRSRYSFQVMALRKHFSGAPASTINVTQGEALPTVPSLRAQLVKGETTAVELTWQTPVSKRKAKWQYAIYYGASLKEMYQQGVRYRTDKTEFTVRHLEACEKYLFDVIVVGPYGYGPGTEDGFKLVITGFDHHSPPKNVDIQFSARNATEALITWSPPCDALTEGLGYLITVRDLTLKKTSHASLSPSRNDTIYFHQSFHYGADYQVSVQIDTTNSRPAGPLSVSGPRIPPPHQLSVGRVNASLVLYWRDQDLPPEVASHNYSYYVWLSKSHTFKENDTLRIETTERMLRLPADHPGELYYAAVSISESHGYESPRSEPLNMLFMMASDVVDPAAESSAHVYIAVAVAVIIAIALGASLLVLFVRHRRLQRTFVSFANSHYDTRSGAATFSDQNLEEDDSPVIRGFSDDEPLVIA